MIRPVTIRWKAHTLPADRRPCGDYLRNRGATVVSLFTGNQPMWVVRWGR